MVKDELVQDLVTCSSKVADHNHLKIYSVTKFKLRFQHENVKVLKGHKESVAIYCKSGT